METIAKIRKKLSLKRLLLFYPLWIIIQKIKNFWITTFYDTTFDSIIIENAKYDKAYSIDEKGINEIDDYEEKYEINGMETEIELFEKLKKRNSAVFISIPQKKET